MPFFWHPDLTGFVELLRSRGIWLRLEILVVAPLIDVAVDASLRSHALRGRKFPVRQSELVRIILTS